MTGFSAATIRLRQRRQTLAFLLVGLALGAGVGVLSAAVVGLPAPAGYRPAFYTELALAASSALAVLLLLLTRARMGLIVLLCALAFLPSRTAMQYQYSGFVIVTATDLAVLLGTVFLLLHDVVLRRDRLQPVAMRGALWLWMVIGVVGTVVAVGRGVRWTNYVPELKAFYLWILIVVLCVNIVRTRLSLRLVMVVMVLSAVPRVLSQLRDVSLGRNLDYGVLAHGQLVARAAGGAGVLNQYAFYLMAVFFITVGLTLTARRWRGRILFGALAVYFAYGIQLTYSRGAFVATAVGLLALGLTGGRRVCTGLLVAAMIGVVVLPPAAWQRFSFDDNSTAERLSYLRTAGAAVRAHPLLGGGWGSDYYVEGNVLVPVDDPTTLPNWHDDYLVVATQIGVPGLLVYLWIWGALAWAALRAYRRAPPGVPGTVRGYVPALLAAMTAMFVQAATDNMAWRNEAGPVIWLVFGLTCATINLVDREARSPGATASPHTGRAA